MNEPAAGSDGKAQKQDREINLKAVFAKEKKEALSKKMGTRMSENEAKQLVNRAVLAGEGRWRDFEESFREMLGKDFESIGVPGSGDLDELKAVVSDLETQFFALDEPFMLGKRI